MGEITFRKFFISSLFLLTFFSTSIHAQPQILKEYEGLNVNYCQANGSILYNFYWIDGHVSGEPFFGSTPGNNLSYVEFGDGTAIISGTSVQGNCSAEIYIVLKERKNWTDWQASGGSFKPMGCSDPDPTEMYYYVIDGDQSYVTTTGGDCAGEGTYRVTQRPDPLDLSTPHLGAHVGVGGMLFDTNSQEEGLATWAWMGPEDDLRRWKIDFNFILKCIVNNVPPSCTINGTDVTCYGDNDGTATVNVSDGLPPYSYSWDGGIQDTDGEVDNLAPGTYTVTVTDSNGKETSCQVTIDGPDQELSCEVTKNNNVSVNGGMDGSATVNASGGTMPYSYLWSNGETTQTVNNLPAGMHSVTVTDANGCDTMCEVEIDEPRALSCTIQGTDVDCYGDDDGTASVNVNGGMPPYSYSWDSGIQDTDGELENLAPGTYKVTVTDNNGAMTMCQVTIDGPSQELSCEISKNNDVSINGGMDGSATVNASGGTMPYSYLWSNGETTKTVNNLPVGMHSVTVTDANDCETMCEVEINEPGPLSCSIQGTDVDCFGDDDGTATVMVNGGVPPFSYSWDSGIQDNSDMIGNLAPGTYKVTVTDNNGAMTMCQVTIDGPSQELSCEITKNNDVSINGGMDGSATVNATGGTMPYTYLWSNGEITQSVNNLPAGMHSVTVTDANDCMTMCEVEINEPGPLSCSIQGTDVDCFGDDDGTATVMVNGGVPPYIYSWDSGIQDNSDMIGNLAPGTYKVTVTDNNGAMTMCQVTIDGPTEELSCDITKLNDVSEEGESDGSATVNVSGGTMPYSYLWSNGEMTQTATQLDAGTHSVTVTDANNCMTMCEVEIEEPDVEVPQGCETAFAQYAQNNTCFIDDGFSRWGWTNFIEDEGTYNFELYSAAGQCNIGNGFQSGNVTVDYDDDMVTVTINMSAGFVLTEAHLYIGAGKYPTKPNGTETVAPGQYDQVNSGLNDLSSFQFDTVDVSGLQDGFYIIVHAVTCSENDTNGIVDRRQPLVKPYPTVFQGELSVDIEVQKPTSGAITIYGTNGRVAKQINNVKLNQGINTFRINTNDLSGSMYFLEVRTADGGKVMKKVISK